MLIDINNTDNVTLFWYIIIFVLTLYAFSRINVTLNIVYGTFIVLLILYFLNNEYTKTKTTINNILKEKNNSIIPKSGRLKNYNNIINFLFSIQDFYVYNPPAYEDMVQSLDIFFIYYEEVLNNNKLAGGHYDILSDRKKYILNSLQSIIYDFPVNAKYTKKLNDSVKILNDILTEYMVNIKKINSNNIYTNGYNMNTKLISNDNIVPYNSFNSNDNFDMY